jgi:C1A family cysteine protease
LILSLIVFSVEKGFSIEHVEVRRSIIESYMDGSPKELFKVFHYVFEKPYDLNSEVALAKYRVFKNNLKLIKEHNAKKLSWTLEINSFADMSEEEMNSYMGLAPINTSNEIAKFMEENSKKSELSFFDQFADDDNDPNPPNDTVTFADVDHSDYLTPTRDQGNCGSCWAFSAISVIEANYNKLRNLKSVGKSGYLSVQAILDCNSQKSGCDGGWPTDAIVYVAQNGAVKESDYPYIANRNSKCTSAPTVSDIKFNATPYEGCVWNCDRGIRVCTKKTFYTILSNGPVSTVVDGNVMRFYGSGIIDASKVSCISQNHAVVAYAWLNVTDNTGNAKYIIKVRNSWGNAFGDNGNYSFYYDTNGSCFISTMAIRAYLV